MMPSLVDYVLERGAVDYGEFAPKGPLEAGSAALNHRKLLAFMLEDEQGGQSPPKQIGVSRISDLKINQIAGQVNHLSEKMHAQLSKRHQLLDADLYKLENQWLLHRIPDFYSYYFLKFAYANSFSRMHEIVLAEIENSSLERSTYVVMQKTIQARQACLVALRRQASALDQLTIATSLKTLEQEMEARRKIKLRGNLKDDQNMGNNGWNNALQGVFQLINHLRKLSCYIVELIKNWRTATYQMSDDPRKYRQRVIFYHDDANYLLKILCDTYFLKDTVLAKYLQFSKRDDPFVLRPMMILDANQKKSVEQEILFELIKPSEVEMSKMIKALVLLAEEYYDEQNQSRFLDQRKNYGDLEARKKLFLEKRNIQFKNMEQNKSQQKIQILKRQVSKNKLKEISFVKDKKSSLTKEQIQGVEAQKKQQLRRSRIQSTLNRVKKIRSIDLKKVSPYLSRNERLEKAQRVIELQHKFKVAQNEYNLSALQKQQNEKRIKIKKVIQAKNDSENKKIFNKYLQQNLKLMEEANKKAFLYKNTMSPVRQHVASSVNFNRISFHARKEAQYERNLQQYYPRDSTPQVRQNRQIANPKGSKAIIQISDKGIRAANKIVQFELGGKKQKNLGQILERQYKKDQKNIIINKFNGKKQIQSKEQTKKINLFQSQKDTEIIILRQEPQKIQEIKQYLYAKIKQQLIEEMKKTQKDREQNINNLIQEEKRKKIDDIIRQRKQQEQKRREQQQRKRLQQLELQRRKISFQIRIQPIQHAQQNINQYFSKMFDIEANTYRRLFIKNKVQQKIQEWVNEMHLVVLHGYYENNKIGHCVAKYDWHTETARKWVIEYIVTKQSFLHLSTLHCILKYFWEHDPTNLIELVLLDNSENPQGEKVCEHIKQYASRNGEIFQKRLYSNVVERKFIWLRPESQKQKFQFTHYSFGKKFKLRAQLLSSNISLNQRHATALDLNLQTFTNYIFLLQELFRCYLTPEEVVQLRQNSTNIRRLKDIFRIVLQLQKSRPVVEQLTIVEGINLEDVYDKLKNKKSPPYERYFWDNFYDRTNSNRILLSMMQTQLQLPFSINSCLLDDRKFLRLNPIRKILTLKSSIYAKENIYILNTDKPKIRLFLFAAESFKLMRMELFIFLNLLFNNIVEDKQKYVSSFWIPQFAVNSDNGKLVRRITDFSISMKKSFFLGQQIYFCNQEYIKGAISFLPKQSDVIFRESFVIGLLHTDVEQGTTGLPMYAKVIDEKEYF